MFNEHPITVKQFGLSVVPRTFVTQQFPARVSVQGGEATRITTGHGAELGAKFSPDGQWLAFTGEYDGGRDVYVMPAAGGEPTRLTFHPGWDRVIDWEPDGKRVRFQSARESHTGRDLQLYTVSYEGGLPVRNPLPTAGSVTKIGMGSRR